MLHNKVVAVTGGAGFIGSHLVDQLSGLDVEKIIIIDNMFLGKTDNIKSHLDNSKIKLVVQDASNIEHMEMLFTETQIDVVFNLAVVPLPASLKYPKIMCEENINITLTMCELHRRDLFKTFIHCSSSEACGDALSKSMDETHPLNPTTPYAASKAASDLYVQTYWNTFGLDTSIVRPFNNYGPRQNELSYAGIIPIVIKRIINGKQPIIYGDGKQTRDYIFVEETAKSFIDVYNHNNTRGKIINIATGNEITINQLVNTIINELGWSGGLSYREWRKGDVMRHCGNIDLAKNLFGFNPKISLEEGIKKTVDWYKQLYSKEVC